MSYTIPPLADGYPPAANTVSFLYPWSGQPLPTAIPSVVATGAPTAQRRHGTPLPTTTIKADTVMARVPESTSSTSPAPAVPVMPAPVHSDRRRVVEEPHLRAQVRVLEHEVKLLREGLAKAATSTRIGVATTSSSSGAGAAAVTGRPQIASGCRVYSSPTKTRSRSAASRLPAVAKTVTKRVSPSRAQRSIMPQTPDNATTNVSNTTTPVSVPGQSIALQGNGTSASLLPQSSAYAFTTATEALAASEGRYWLSADPMYTAQRVKGQQSSTKTAASAGAATSTPATATADPPPLAATVTEVRLSPAASAASGTELFAALRQAAAGVRAESVRAAVTAFREAETASSPTDTVAGGVFSMSATPAPATPPPPQPQPQPQPLVQAATSCSPVQIAPGAAVDPLADFPLEEQARILRDVVQRQEECLRIMAVAMVEQALRQQQQQTQHTVPQAAVPTSNSTSSNSEQNQNGSHSSNTAISTEARAELALLCEQLSQSQRAVSCERSRRQTAEAAATQAASARDKLADALAVLRTEHERMTGVRAVTSVSPAPSLTPATREPAVETQASAAAAKEAADVAKLQEQVALLTRKLKAWERWYFQQRQQSRDQKPQQSSTQYANKPDATDPFCQCCHLSSFLSPYHGAYERWHWPSPAETADPLAYVPPWWHPPHRSSADKNVGVKAEAEATVAPSDTAAASVAQELVNGERRANGEKMEKTASASAAINRMAGPVRLASDGDVRLDAFIAHERALRELATAEREVVEERLRARWRSQRSEFVEADGTKKQAKQQSAGDGAVCTPR